MSVTKKMIYLNNQKVTPGENPGSAAGNGLGIDRLNFDTAIIMAAVGAVAASTLDVKVQHSSDDGATDAYADFEIDGTVVALDQLDTDNTSTTKKVDLSGAKRYIRLVTSGAPTDFATTVALNDGEYGTDWENVNQYDQE